MSLAKAILSGTVSSDPEKRFTPNQNVAVTTFTLDVTPASRGNQSGPGGNNDAPFTLKVTCWRQLAEAAGDQIRKGDAIVVDGRLLTSTYQTPEGVQKKSFELEANHIEKLEAPSQPLVLPAGEARGAAAPQAARYATPPGGGNIPSAPVSAPSQPTSEFQGFSSEEMLTEDDIPF